MYVFGSSTPDGSLTGLLLSETKGPSAIAALQAPYRVHADPVLRQLERVYGETAVRLWVICLANPGWLYSTNPSTMSTFLDRVCSDWPSATACIRAWVRDARAFSPAVHAIAGRLVSTGARERMQAVARSDRPLALWEIAPGVHSYSCWTGGYVQPFLDRLREHLPETRYRLLPMFSMSTETKETTACFRNSKVAYVPLAKGVVYEFLPLGKSSEEDRSEMLLQPQELQRGGRYTMVVSDRYGLRRYQTDDVFLCVGRVGSLPDLRFERRRSLSYSFTGEKVTGQQIADALDGVRVECPLPTGSFLSCAPSIPAHGGLPHYVLLLVLRPGESSTDCMAAAADRCDALLRENNAEYDSKRASDRLGPMRGAAVSLAEFLEYAGASGATGAWEAQFKFLPLQTRLWEHSALEAEEIVA
jgi:hypothetical protein